MIVLTLRNYLHRNILVESSQKTSDIEEVKITYFLLSIFIFYFLFVFLIFNFFIYFW